MRQKKSIFKILITIILVIVISIAIVFVTFEVTRAYGKQSLEKVEVSRPILEQIPVELIPEEEKSDWEEGWISHQGKIYEYNEDIMTFLIMGIDKQDEVVEVEEGTDGGQADALFLAVMNPHTKTVQVIGINRNTMTDIDIYNEMGEYVTTVEAQIAVQHGFGNGVEKSCEYQKEAVSKLFYNLPIHGYAAINMSAISVINDSVGGVDITVLEDLTHKDPLLVKDANVHLLGDSAYWYIRERDTDVFGSADVRLSRQKQYLNAFIKTAKSAAKEDISIVLDLYHAIMPYMTTDISANEIAYLAPTLLEYQFDKDSLFIVEGETIMGEEFEEFYVDEDSLYELILNVFYEEVVRE